MNQKIKTKLCGFFSVLMLVLTFLIPPTVLAAADIQNSLCTGGTSGVITDNPNSQTCNNIGDQSSTSTSLASTIINILSVLVGFVAVVMMIVGGFRYISSGGSSEAVGKAKNTILYALIGLVIVAVAQIIVQFVLNKTNCAANGNPNTKQCK